MKVSIKVSIKRFVINLEEDERFIMYLAAPFDDSRIDGGAKISIKSSFMEIIFSLSIKQR